MPFNIVLPLASAHAPGGMLGGMACTAACLAQQPGHGSWQLELSGAPTPHKNSPQCISSLVHMYYPSLRKIHGKGRTMGLHWGRRGGR